MRLILLLMLATNTTTTKICITGPSWGESSGDRLLSLQRASTAESVFMSWRQHARDHSHWDTIDLTYSALWLLMAWLPIEPRLFCCGLISVHLSTLFGVDSLTFWHWDLDTNHSASEINSNEWMTRMSNRPISHIPQCIRLISHIAAFCSRNVHTCAYFYYKMVYCRIWNWCIMRFVE